MDEDEVTEEAASPFEPFSVTEQRRHTAVYMAQAALAGPINVDQLLEAAVKIEAYLYEGKTE